MQENIYFCFESFSLVLCFYYQLHGWIIYRYVHVTEKQENMHVCWKIKFKAE